MEMLLDPWSFWKHMSPVFCKIAGYLVHLGSAQGVKILVDREKYKCLLQAVGSVFSLLLTLRHCNADHNSICGMNLARIAPIVLDVLAAPGEISSKV